VFSGFTVLPFGAPVLNGPGTAGVGLSQTIAPFCGGPFTLTINGQGFQEGAIASVGGVNLVTSLVSSTQVKAQVSTAALWALGTRDVTVTNPGNLTSNVLPIKVVVRGDTNGSGNVNIGDALVMALTAGGVIKPPLPVSVGDVNLSGSSNIGDALALALFAGRVTSDWPTSLISLVSPSPATAGGTITITGSGFLPLPSDHIVVFTTSSGVTKVVPSAASLTALTVTVPNNAVSGVVQVQRTDAALRGREFPLLISGSTTPLALTRVTPYYRVQAGSTVILEGIGFDATTTNNLVQFKSSSGAVTATVKDATPTSLTVTVPQDATCGPVTVTAGAQTSNARVVTISGANCVLLVVGISGGGSPGDTVILEGSGFDVANPANNVVRFSAANEATVTAPVLAAGSTLLHIRIPDGAIDGNVTVNVGGATSNAIAYRLPVRP
jgi:hypothetical protein